MPILKDEKFSFDDFANFEAINIWWDDLHKDGSNRKDKEGYTPIGAAILNGAPLECIAYLMQLYTYNGSPDSSQYSKKEPFKDIENDISKGRSPIGVACLTMNADAIDVLRSNYYEYVLKDEDGNPIPKLDHYGDPIDAEKYVMYTSVPLFDEYTKESYKYSKEQKLSEVYKDNFPKYKACKDTDADWLAAAALPKADILVKLIKPEASTKPNFNDILDDNRNTLILLACVAGCHESVEHIRDNCSNFNNVATIDDENPDQIFIKNSDDLTAFDVALESQDTDLLPLLLGDQINDAFIKQLLVKYFHEKANKKVNRVLIKLVTSEHIYNYYISEKYDYGDSGDPDYDQYYIVEYIEKENDSSLFNLLLLKYNDPAGSYVEHLNTFFNTMCSHLIAFLYKKSYIPFNNANPTDNLNTLLNFHTSDLYVNIVEILFKSGYVTLEQICDIEEEQKRNKCIDKIFTSTYNKQLFVQLLKVDSDNRDSILVHLYSDKHYFTLQHIAELQGDQSLDKSDEFLFDVIYELVGNNIAIIESDIDSTYSAFKIDCCVYLYTDDKVTISDIIDSSCSSEFKCAIINKLYNNGSGNLKLDDIYYIYNNYDSTLSGLHSDLMPLIKCMKYCENDIITSDFFWAYNFSSHSSTSWSSPQKSYVDIPPITDSELVRVGDSSSRYSRVRISARNTSIKPNEFRLDVYNCKPEFEIDSSYNLNNLDYAGTDHIKNAMAVAFGSDIGSINDSISHNIPVQSDDNELYSIESDTYLGESVKIINWSVIPNSLSTSLHNQLCYSKKSSELPVINSIQFITNDDYSDLDVILPASGNKITAISDTHWSLPSVSVDTYTDTEGVRYETIGWKIGSDIYDFGDDYTFNEHEAVAQLEFERAYVTLTYLKSNYDTLDFALPAAVKSQSGNSITLPVFSSQYYYDISGIKYEAKNWIIDGQQYEPGASYRILDSTVAELNCDISSVTLAYTRTAGLSLYDKLGNKVTWPSTITRDSGTIVTLASLLNTYYNEDKTKIYNLTGWKIGSINYNFGATYTLKDSVTASLQYTESAIDVSIWCNVDFNTPASVTEGGSTISRKFKLSHEPAATTNVTLRISSTITDRLYIGTSASSTTTSVDLTFTALNWDSERTVYFRAIDDTDTNGEDNGVVNVKASSAGDSRYNNLSESFSITVNDNDTASIGKLAFTTGTFAIDDDINYITNVVVPYADDRGYSVTINYPIIYKDF